MSQRDYWSSSGYRHLTVGTDGRLTVTDAYLRAQLLRPELARNADFEALRGRREFAQLMS